MDALATKLPQIGDAIGDMFSMMAEHADSGAKALSMLLDVVNVGIRNVTLVLDMLAEGFELFDKIPTWLTGMAGVWVDSAGKSAEATTDWNTKLQGLRDAITGVGTAAVESASDIRTYDEMMRELTGETLDARDAQRSMEQAIDDATASYRENGKTLDINTAKGRANQSALDGIARAANRTYDAVLKQTGSQAEATKAAQRGRDAFITLATKMLGSREAAVKLADALLQVQGKYTATVDVNIATAQSRLNKVMNQLARIEGYSEGGVVEGPGPKGVDSKLAMLAPGEGVLTVEGLRRLGGKEALDALNRGGVPTMSLAGGSGGGGGGTVVKNYWTVNVPPTANPAEVGRQVVESIKEYERRSGARWRS